MGRGKEGLDAILNGKKSNKKCEAGAVVSWLGGGGERMQGWALVHGGWGLSMGAMQPPAASVQDPSFLNLSSLSR
jgi:hypothetical protein